MSNYISPVLTPVLSSIKGSSVGVNVGYSYTPEAIALFARMTTQPTTVRAQLIDACIRSLLTANVWNTLDSLYMMAAANSQAACLNWKQNSYNLTPTNSPTFTTDKGYTGDGASAYLATGANSGSLTNFKQNSANLFVWQLNNIQSAHAIADTFATNTIQPRTSSNKFYVRTNDGGTGSAAINIATTDATGLTTTNRNSATSRQLYKNGSLVGSDTQDSVAPNSNIQILGITGGFTLGQEAVAGFGSSLDATKELAKYNAIRTYLLGVGAI